MVTNPISTAMENDVANSGEIATHYMHLISEMAVKVVRNSGVINYKLAPNLVRNRRIPSRTYDGKQ